MNDEVKTDQVLQVSIPDALILAKGNKSRAAKMAGFSRQTLYYWLKKHMADPPIANTGGGRPKKIDPKVKAAALKAAGPQKKRSTRTVEQEQHTDMMRMVTVTLTMRHDRNGQIYGPGTVRVPNHLATDLLHTEQQATIEEEKFRGTKGVIIGSRAGTGSVQTKIVPVETFDDSLNQAEPFATVRGGR